MQGKNDMELMKQQRKAQIALGAAKQKEAQKSGSQFNALSHKWRRCLVALVVQCRCNSNTAICLGLCAAVFHAATADAAAIDATTADDDANDATTNAEAGGIIQ